MDILTPKVLLSRVSGSMTSPYNKINRLRSQGHTWDGLGRELAKARNSDKLVVARNTLRSLQKLPHYNPGKELISAINVVHDRHNPSPFPPGVNALMNTCRSLMNADGKDHLATQGLDDIELHVREQLKETIQKDRIACRLNWVLGNISQFRMRQARLKNESPSLIEELQLKAVDGYRKSLQYIEQNDLPNEYYKLLHNIFVCFVNAVPEKERNSNNKLIDQLEQISYVSAAKGLLNKEPFQWETARNGLLYCSITKDREGVAGFYESLVDASELFTDLAYRPLGCDPIGEDPSLAWALKNILTPNWVQVIVDKRERTKPLAKSR